MNLIEEIEKEQIAAFEAEKSVPDFQPGDTVKVNVKVRCVTVNVEVEAKMGLS